MRRVLALAFAGLLALSGCGYVPRSAAGSSPSPSPSPAVSSEPLQVSAMTLQEGEVGLAYSAPALQPAGGVQPYTFSVVSGALPAGLAISGSGTIAGTPAESGSFTFTVMLQDAAGNQATANDSLVVVPQLKATPVSAGTITVEQGCNTACGLFATHVGGQSPLKYAVVSGALPTGTSLSGTSLAGTFTTPGSYQFSVTVTDTLGATSTASASYVVVPHLMFFDVTPVPFGDGVTKINYDAGTGHAFSCDQVASHPDCHVILTFTGGVGPSYTDYTATYKMVKSDPSPFPAAAISGPSLDITDVPFNSGTVKGVNMVMGVQIGSGVAWSGEFLITVTDQATCGPGPSTHCSAQAYVLAGVMDPRLRGG